jgi:PAS domain S-box-containing protein
MRMTRRPRAGTGIPHVARPHYPDGCRHEPGTDPPPPFRQGAPPAEQGVGNARMGSIGLSMSQHVPSHPARVLVVEADPAHGRFIGELLGDCFAPGMPEVVHASTLAEAAEAVRIASPDVILLDPSLPGGGGMYGVRALRAQAPRAALVLLVEPEDEAAAMEMLGAGAQDYLLRGEVTARLLARSIGGALARSRTEAAHRESEARLRSLFEQSLDAVLLTAPDGTVLAANPAACRMFGYTEAEFRALGRGAVADPDDPRLAAALEERARTGRFTGELTLVHKDGRRMATELSSRVFMDAEGRERTSLFIRDVTGRKRAEAALAASERKYRALVQGLHDGVFLCDHENRVIEATDRFLEMTGYGADEIAGRSVADLVDPEDLALAPLRREELGRTGKLVSERVLRRRDGQPLPVEVASVLLGDGRVECVVRDIRERKRADREKGLLAEAGQVFASSLDEGEMLRALAELLVPAHVDVCMIDVLGDDGLPVTAALRAADPRHEQQLRAILERYPHTAGPDRHPVGRVLQTGEALLLPRLSDADLQAMAHDDAYLALVRELPLPGSSMVVPLVARGRICGALTLTAARSSAPFDARDLELAMELARRAALALEKARLNERLTAAVRARDQVLSYVAHDLRSPLGGISLMAGLLLRHPSGEAERRRSLEAIVQAAGQMDRLIQDLLDAGRIEGGRLRLDAEPLAVEPVVREAMLVLERAAAEAGVRLSAELPADLPLVLADRGRLLQVLANLVENAIRFTPRGGRITLRAAAAETEVTFAVADTGPGIAPEDLPHLFDRFWQAQRTGRGGAGLGLAIARGIVEEHGGRIWAESRAGAGSTFCFTLPRSRAAPVPAPGSAGPPLPGAAQASPPPAAPDGTPAVRVLVVDDHPVVRRGLRELLSVQGCYAVVGEAGSGPDAVRQARELVPDVVLMDLGMPGGGGIAAIAQITAHDPRVKVLAFTADSADECLADVLQAGGRGLVSKSTAHRDLLSAVDTVAKGRLFLDGHGTRALARDVRAGVRRSPDDPFAQLTAAERQVALLTAQGFTSREIGKRVFLAPKTVDAYRAQLMRKLGLEHRAQLVRLAVRAGLLRAE